MYVKFVRSFYGYLTILWTVAIIYFFLIYGLRLKEVQISKWKHSKNVSHLFEAANKYSRLTLSTLFPCLYCQVFPDLTRYSKSFTLTPSLYFRMFTIERRGIFQIITEAICLKKLSNRLLTELMNWMKT